VSVSGATVRNRIARLEESGGIEGYHPTINFEQADDALLIGSCVSIFGIAPKYRCDRI